MKNKIMILCVTIISLLFIAACQPVEPGTTTPTGTGTYDEYSFDYDKDINTKQFKDESELLNLLQDTSGGYNDIYSMKSMGRGMGVEMMADMAISPTVSGAAFEEQSLDFSETNIQVEGVDEADIIKTDGDYIYTISSNILYIIKAYPGEDAEIVSTIKFDSNPSSLFINDDTLAVFGNDYDYDYYDKYDFVPYSSMSFFNVYDISDRDDPELEKEYKFEGGYFRARMKGDYVYFITTTYPQYYVDQPLPRFIEEGEIKTVSLNSIYYYDIHYQSPMYVITNTINLDDTSEDVSTTAVVVEGSQNMYMSQENIYITYTQYLSEYELQQQITMELLEDELSEREINLIEKIKLTDNDVLSQYEKKNKIWQVYSTFLSRMDRDEQDELQDKAEILLKKKLNETKYMEYTVINRIAVDDNEVKPEANSKVPGHIINQFSLDEYNDVLRIATTVSARWSRFDSTRTESQNNIYTLDMDLDELDSIEGMASGEQIYSTRFILGRLYMVTFRQIDPFFVIDLSSPKNIKELGELKIPGFSRYLHPYDEDTIIGIAQDATETGRTTG